MPEKKTSGKRALRGTKRVALALSRRAMPGPLVNGAMGVSFLRCAGATLRPAPIGCPGTSCPSEDSRCRARGCKNLFTGEHLFRRSRRDARRFSSRNVVSLAALPKHAHPRRTHSHETNAHSGSCELRARCLRRTTFCTGPRRPRRSWRRPSRRWSARRHALAGPRRGGPATGDERAAPRAAVRTRSSH
jgi:hypothetical protein